MGTVNTHFDNVKTLINGMPVQYYDAMIYFTGTYGKKRKLDRQQITHKQIEANKLWELSSEEVTKTAKDLIIEAVKTHRIKATGRINVRFSGKAIEDDSGIKITRSDSNLMINAPKYEFTIDEVV